MAPIDVKAKKITAGEYAVIINGSASSLRVVKCETPKYRERQEWLIVDGEDNYLTYDQTGLDSALGTIRRILSAANQ